MAESNNWMDLDGIDPRDGEVRGNWKTNKHFQIHSFSFGASHTGATGGVSGDTGARTTSHMGTVSVTMPVASCLPALYEGAYKAGFFEKVMIGVYGEKADKNNVQITLEKSNEDNVKVLSCQVDCQGQQTVAMVTFAAPKISFSNEAGKDVSLDIMVKDDERNKKITS